MSSSPISLDQIHTLLSGFIEYQQAFNAKQEAFNAKQENFQAEQMAFNQIALERFNRLETGLESLEKRFDRSEEETHLQHGITHRLIMQAFEHITDLQAQTGITNTEPRMSWVSHRR